MDFYAETKKVLKLVEPGIWAITSPHVLYLSPAQGQAYSANKTNSDYNSFHDTTVNIILDNSTDIIAPYNDGFTLVDLGPEYPDKTLPLMQTAHARGVVMDYVPVDINPNYITIAENAARPYARYVQGIQSLFEDCANKIPANTHKSRMVFIGLTFMNFEPDVILKTMRSIAGPSGHVGVATEFIGPTNTPDKIEDHYRNEQVRKFALGPATNLNIDPAGLDFDIRFRNHRIEFGFVATRAIRHMEPDITIAAGERIIMGVSYRYTLDEWLTILRGRHSSEQTRIWTSPSGCIGFALTP